MDNKQIYAIIAVIIIVVAAVGVYFALGNNGGENSDDDTPDDAKVTMTLNGVVASEENVLNGTYPIQRNLVLVTNGEPTGNVAAFLSWVTVAAFLSWVTSEEGQTILGEEFVKLTEFTTEIQPDPNGQTTIALGGSTSLSETMDKLTRAYMEKYDFMELTVQGGGSGAGESQCHSGEFDIGMLSRDLSQKYADMGLKPITIGQDGVAVIANIDGVVGLTAEQVLGIFSGEIKNWSEVGGPNEPIRVVIREDGSGTRDCFDSYLEGLDENFVCTQAATVCQATGTVITNVQNTYGAIGYISIGQVNISVRSQKRWIT